MHETSAWPEFIGPNEIYASEDSKLRNINRRPPIVRPVIPPINCLFLNGLTLIIII
jgi:hypothetical protein